MENSFKGDLDKRLEILKKLKDNSLKYDPNDKLYGLNKNQMSLKSNSCYTTINRMIKELTNLGMIERIEGNKKENKFKISEKGREFLEFF